MRRTWQALVVAAALAAGGAGAQAPGGTKTGGGRAGGTKAGAAKASAATPADAGSSEDAAEIEQALLALGVSMGRSLEQFALTPAEVEIVQRGIRDQLAGTATVDPETAGPKLKALARERRARASQAFLAARAKKKGARKTPSGLIITDLQVGTGAKPKPTDTVQVHYIGTLPDGREFDSSHRRGTAAQFPLNGVIDCWTEGVGLMKVGGKARLVCPPEIAYGERPPPGSIIPPNSPLEFEVELLDITTGP